jgi:hypothetical protein
VVFVIIAIVSFVALRLSTRARARTLLWIALLIGLAADFTTDLLVMLRSR